MWIYPKSKRFIKLDKLGLNIHRGFATFRCSQYTIKVSKNGFLNIYIKRPILSTLNNIHIIVRDFYNFITTKSGYVPNGFHARITNVQASFEHSLNHYALLGHIKHLESRNIKFLNLKEEPYFTHKCKYGTVTLLPKRGTIITKDLVCYVNLIKELQTNFI